MIYVIYMHNMHYSVAPGKSAWWNLFPWHKAAIQDGDLKCVICDICFLFSPWTANDAVSEKEKKAVMVLITPGVDISRDQGILAVGRSEMETILQKVERGIPLILVIPHNILPNYSQNKKPIQAVRL